MDYPISVPSIGLVDGKFVDEDLLLGTPGSLIPAQWGNAVTEEMLNVLSAAGLSPDELDNTQLEVAIRLINQQPGLLTSTGAANTYAAANTPPLKAFPVKGFLQRIVIATPNTGPATYAPDGLAAKPIYGLGLQPLQGGELPAGVAVLMYLVQAGINGGNGAWIVITSLGGALQIPKGTKINQAVNLSQLGSFSNLLGTATSTTLGANNTGQLVVVTAAGTTQTLPPVSGFVPGTAITIAAWAPCTVKGSGSEQIANDTGASNNALQINPGEQITLVSNGISWYTASYTMKTIRHSGRRNILINARGTINKRAYVSGTATTGAKQFCVDRWYVITSGQSVSWSDSGGVRTFTAPAGGVEQSIRAQNVFGGSYVLSYTGTAVATVNGTTVANGATVTLPANTIAALRFSSGTFSSPQLELGTFATSFDFPNDEQEELICQKYYFRPNTVWLVSGNATAASQRISDGVFFYPSMISTPIATTSTGAGVNVAIGTLSVTQTGLTQQATSVTSGLSSYSFSVISLDSEFVV